MLIRQFHHHEPVGERCSHAVLVADGRPLNEWIKSIPLFKSEMNELENNELDPRLSDAQHQDYKAALVEMMKAASSGRVQLSGLYPPGKVIDRTKFVIELRPKIQSSSAFGKKVRELRLYLAEPATVPASLLGLVVATKEADDSGYHEQDESINEAVERAYVWAS